jgi:hypothetical protein
MYVARADAVANAATRVYLAWQQGVTYDDDEDDAHVGGDIAVKKEVVQYVVQFKGRRQQLYRGKPGLPVGTYVKVGVVIVVVVVCLYGCCCLDIIKPWK